MHLSFSNLTNFKDGLTIRSFWELDHTFANYRPFKFYPFMCVIHPFYFDVQNKLCNLTRETYRFRASIMHLSIERGKGLPSALYYLGLKQSVKLTDFRLHLKNYSFSYLFRFKEYLYLLHNDLPKAWNFDNNETLEPLHRDWFYPVIKKIQFSPLFFECVFEKNYRRFWRRPIKGLWNKHLRIENSFLISSLDSNNSLVDLSYHGTVSSSYHFSFFTDSPDKRSVLYFPAKFFFYQYKRYLYKKFNNFAIFNNFTRTPVSLLSKSHFSSFLSYYCFSLVSYSLVLLLYFYCIFIQPLLPIMPRFLVKLSHPQGLCLTSSLRFYYHGTSYYLPKIVINRLHSTLSYFRKSCFLIRNPTLLPQFKPYYSSSALWNKISHQIKSSYKENKKVFTFEKFLEVNKRNYWVTNKNWANERYNAFLARRYLVATVRKFMARKIYKEVLASAISLRERSFVKQMFDDLFYKYRKSDSFYKPQLKEELRKFRSAWNKDIIRSSFVAKALHNSRKPKRWWKSSLLLNIKFLLVKLLFIFLNFYKSNFLISSVSVLKDSFNSFFFSVMLTMHKFFFVYNLFFFSSIVRKSRKGLLQKLRKLSHYKAQVIERWLYRWEYLYGLMRLLLKQKLFLSGKKGARFVAFYYKLLLKLRIAFWRQLFRISKLSFYLHRASLGNSFVPVIARRKKSLNFLLKKNYLPATAYSRSAELLERRLKFLRRIGSGKFKLYFGIFKPSIRKLIRSNRRKLRKQKRVLFLKKSKLFKGKKPLSLGFKSIHKDRAAHKKRTPVPKNKIETVDRIITTWDFAEALKIRSAFLAKVCHPVPTSTKSKIKNARAS